MEVELEQDMDNSDDNDPGNLDISDNDDDPGNRIDEAEEAPVPQPQDTEEQEGKTIKPKRVVKNPLPKLDVHRLMGPRGIGILQNTFKDVKFKGKGYEKEDLNIIMKKLEHWSHRLFPKNRFDDNLKQIEKLGSKKPVQNMMTRFRLDMFQSDEIDNRETERNDEPGSKDIPEEIDVFDELLGTGPFANDVSENSSGMTVVSAPATDPVNIPAPMSSLVLTEEQKERIERNRRLALERRKVRMAEKMKEGEEAPSSSDRSSNTLQAPIDSSNRTVIEEPVTVVDVDTDMPAGAIDMDTDTQNTVINTGERYMSVGVDIDKPEAIVDVHNHLPGSAVSVDTEKLTAETERSVSVLMEESSTVPMETKEPNWVSTDIEGSVHKVNCEEELATNIDTEESTENVVMETNEGLTAEVINENGLLSQLSKDDDEMKLSSDHTQEKTVFNEDDILNMVNET